MDNQRYDVFSLTERGEKTYWTKVGAAFVNRDESISVMLEALPVNGKLQLRRPVDREDDPPAQSDRRPQRR